MIRKILLSVFVAAAAFMAAAAQEAMTFAYAAKSAKVTPIGSMRVDTYDVAIALTNPSVYGMTITAVEIPVLTSPDIKDLSLWLSKSLKLKQEGSVKVNVPDISIPVEMPAPSTQVQWVTVQLDQPYVIPDGGVYVGYSFSVDALGDNNVNRYPVVAASGFEPGSMYLHTTRTYKSWEDRSNVFNAVSMLQVTMVGNTVPANAARLGNIPFKYVAANAENTIDVMVYNVGSDPIKTLDYTFRTNKSSVTETLELSSPIPATFGYGEPVQFTLPEFTDEGECNVSLTINAINGEACSGVAARGKVQVALFVPKHIALVEEYTGMWCGNCPKGFVAMEEMAKMYPDYIGIAYHNRDNLAMESGDPGMTDAFPNAFIDRAFECDPYYADPAVSTFSLPQVWERYCAEFSPVEITVDAVWDESDQTVMATTTLDWATVPADAATANYRIEYVLVADGLSNPRWYQTNYFYDGRLGYPEYMDVFTHGDQYVFGLTFNDVALLTSGFRGVKGSIPNIEVGNKTTHTYTFNTKEAYNYLGEQIAFDKDKLRVVAFVLRGDGPGAAVNAAQCDVAVNEGIHSIADDRTPVSTELYDLSGRKLQHPQPGVVIRLTRYSDGTVSRKAVY